VSFFFSKKLATSYVFPFAPIMTCCRSAASEKGQKQKRSHKYVQRDSVSPGECGSTGDHKRGSFFDMFTQSLVLAVLCTSVTGKHAPKKSHNRDAVDFYVGADNIPTRGEGAPKVRETITKDTPYGHFPFKLQYAIDSIERISLFHVQRRTCTIYHLLHHFVRFTHVLSL